MLLLPRPRTSRVLDFIDSALSYSCLTILYIFFQHAVASGAMWALTANNVENGLCRPLFECSRRMGWVCGVGTATGTDGRRLLIRRTPALSLRACFLMAGEGTEVQVSVLSGAYTVTVQTPTNYQL